MKKIFQILLIILVSQVALAQNKKGVVYLNDGSQLKGLVKLTKGNKVKYRLNKESEKRIFNKHSVDRVVLFKEDGELEEFAFRQIERSSISSIKVMQVITRGKITLYKVVTHGTHYYGGGLPGQAPMMGASYSISNYYVGKEDSKLVNQITSKGALFEKNFKKAAMNYFKDCPALVKLIENKTYRKRDLEEIVKYYNEKC